MEKRFTFRTVRMVVAVAMLLLSPLFALGQGDKKIQFEFKLIDEANNVVEPKQYAYEFRVGVRGAGTSIWPRYVGAYRAWETTDGYYLAKAETEDAPLTFYPGILPIKCSAGDEVFIDWYDHVMTVVKNVNEMGGDWEGIIYYPKEGRVTIKKGNGVPYAGYSDKSFSGPVVKGALDAEVRIPWQHVKDVDKEIYTVLNKAVGDNDNFSFTLPSDLEDNSKVEVTLIMAKKKWKTLKFTPNKEGKTFDGSMRVRMKSPGDDHFMMNYLKEQFDSRIRIASGPFYEAYPYPSKTFKDPKSKNADREGHPITDTPLMLEGTLMVVEARSWAKDGVCVDNKWNARSVKLANPGDVTQISLGSVGDDGQAHSGDYWLVPLWSEGDVVEVMPGPCPGAMLKISYKSAGIGYTGLQLYRDEECSEEVKDGGEVESGHPLYGRCNPSLADPCKALRVRWRIAPSGPWQERGLVKAGKFSFTPKGDKGKTIEVELQQEDKETVLHYDADNYQVECNGALKNDREKVPCGSTVKVDRKGVLAAGACYDRVAVKVNGTPQGEIVWDATGEQWKGINVNVDGSEANFSFKPIENKYKVSWNVAADAGYTLEVKVVGAASGIGNGGSVDCGSPLEITVTPGISGRKVLSIEAVGPTGLTVARVEGSNTLSIPRLEHDIAAINVQLGADPNGLTVNVDEKLDDLKVADITVLNVTRGESILWKNGKLENDGRFEEGDELKVSYKAAQCIDDSQVQVEVRERDGNVIKVLKIPDHEVVIPEAKKGIDVKVTTGGELQYQVKWDKPGFKVRKGGVDLTSGGSVACGSSIEIVPDPPACKLVEEVKVNGKTVDSSQDGKYLHEVKEKVDSIEVTWKPKTIRVTWDDVTNVDVEVKGATVNCGEELTVVFKPKAAGDGAVQAVMIAEEGKGDVTLTPNSHAGYTWEGNKPKAGQTTVKWSPEGNVTIKSVALPEKYTIKYENGQGYTVKVVDRDGNLVDSGSKVLGGELTVKVTVANPAGSKVVKVNGDENVKRGTTNGEYTYTFTITKDTEVTVELGKRKYKVSYVQSADVKEMKVCEGDRSGSEIVSDSEVEYGRAIYVYVAVEKKQGSAVQGVKSVTVKYKNLSDQSLDVDGDGWYKLGKLEGEIVGIDVIVEKLKPGEVLIVYSKEAQGGEGEQPYGAKGIVTWKDKDGQPIAAGQKKKVNVSDSITWSLEATGVEDSKLIAVCLAVNRGYAQPLEGTDREKAYRSLGELLNLVEGLKDKVMAQEVTEVKLETYVTVKLDQKPLLVITVRKPQLGGDLKVIMPGAGGAWLEYDKSYRVSGEGKTEVTLKAEAKSPVVLKEIYVEGKERLGLTKEMESTYKLPPYDLASTNGNRLTFYAIFAQEDADNCLLTLQANPPEGGAVTALRKSNKEELSSGQQYQRELDVEVRVQAKEGYYIKSVIQNGSELYGNVQSDTTKVMYSFPIKLPAKKLLVQADFSPIPRGGKEGKTNAVESAALRGVEIYPNPTDGAIEVRGASGVARYAVYDVTGREMLGGVHDGGAQLRIDLGMLASGFYIVQLRSADGGMRAEGVLRR